MAADTSPFRFALAELPVPLVYATHRIIRDCNEPFTALFGASRADIVERSFSRLYPEIADFIRRGEQWGANLRDGVYCDERVMERLGGERFWCRVHGRSLSGAAAPFARAIYWFQPITRPVAMSTTMLTERQREILAQMAQGKTSAQIAAELGLSRRTIESHRARLMKSMHLRNAPELMGWFLGNGSRTSTP